MLYINHKHAACNNNNNKYFTSTFLGKFLVDRLPLWGARYRYVQDMPGLGIKPLTLGSRGRLLPTELSCWSCSLLVERATLKLISVLRWTVQETSSHMLCGTFYSCACDSSSGFHNKHSITWTQIVSVHSAAALSQTTACTRLSRERCGFAWLYKTHSTQRLYIPS